jgi:hypothetical protein
MCVWSWVFLNVFSLRLFFTSLSTAKSPAQHLVVRFSAALPIDFSGFSIFSASSTFHSLNGTRKIDGSSCNPIFFGGFYYEIHSLLAIFLLM